MRVRRRLPAAGLALLLASGPAAAAPALHATVGGTTAILGAVEAGGPALSVAALWPIGWLGLESGFAGHADDFGSISEDLADPATGQPAGRAEGLHRAAYAAAWRLDARPWPGTAWSPFASGSWGLYRLRDDRLGDTRREWSSTGFSLGAGVRRALRGRLTLGAEVRYHRLFNDRAGRYASAALEWGWR